MDCIVHGVSKGWTRLSNIHFHKKETTHQAKEFLGITNDLRTDSLEDVIGGNYRISSKKE